MKKEKINKNNFWGIDGTVKIACNWKNKKIKKKKLKE